MKSVLRSAKPYWIYLILTGKKTLEVGKDFPKSEDWDKIVEMYCSKDMRSFNRIPENDREWMRKYLGKVACRFVCDRIDTYYYGNMDYPTPAFDGDERVCEIGDGYYITSGELEKTCLPYEELEKYGKGKTLYGWHISDLKIYDTPKELGEFYSKTNCEYANTGYCKICTDDCKYHNGEFYHSLTRPPATFCYVKE